MLYKNRGTTEGLQRDRKGDTEYRSKEGIEDKSNTKVLLTPKEKKLSILEKSFGKNRVVQSQDIFKSFLGIGKSGSYHNEIQSIKNICNILKEKTASLEDLIESVKNYKIVNAENISNGYLFTCSNFFGRDERYLNFVGIDINQALQAPKPKQNQFMTAKEKSKQAFEDFRNGKTPKSNVSFDFEMKPDD